MFRKLFSRPAPTAATNADSRLTYLPGLDGLRALAVLAVLLYHADMVWLPGGFLGVEVFFVVSGYLITALLLAEYRAHNKINLKKFWQRRARRLLPALFAMLIAVAVGMVLLLPDEVASIRADIVAAFAYITNWYLIAAQKSYFETIGRPSLLQHLWSLAVEEQFYLLWPLIFAFILTRLKTRGALLLLMFGATLSALWMGFLYHPDTDPSRVYYGTDTRAAGLLIGAALAFVWTPQRDETKRTWRNWSLDGIGIVAFAGLICAFLFLDEFNPFLYQGGLLLVAIATAFVIAAVVHPKSPVFGALLGFGLLQWIGLRSYSLYLWHWPVFMVTRPQLDTTLEGMQLLLFRFGVTFLIAEISFRIIEKPIRGGMLGRAWNSWNETRGARRWSLGTASLVIVGALVMLGVALGNIIANAQPPPEPDFVLALPQEEPIPQPLEEMPLEMPSLEENAENQVASPASSEMTSVSFILPQENEAEISEAMVNELPTAPVRDAWEQKLALARVPKIYFKENDFDSAFRRNVARVRNPVRGCDKACVAQLEFREIKGARLKPAAPSKRIIPIPTKPATAIANSTTAAKSNPTAATVAPLPNNSAVEILAIGDSVMLGASHYMRKSIGTLLVDAKLGRQVSTSIRLLQAYKDANRLPQTIVVHLGNNGTFTAKQFDEMMAVLSKVPRVVFVNAQVPRKWQDTNNSALSEGVRRYPNARLLDWHSVSATHPEWFWKDGIHLRPEGAQVYANLIAATLQPQEWQP